MTKSPSTNTPLRPITPASSSEPHDLTGDSIISEATKQWLGPMFVEIVNTQPGGTSLGLMLQRALNNCRDTDGINVDWIKIGQHFRTELGWDLYPETPEPPEAP